MAMNSLLKNIFKMEISGNMVQNSNNHTMMEELIRAVNKLQDAFSTLGAASNTIELPQIVMLGSQSAGKSSCLESIIKKSFLPRGTGIVTRCPLVLQLIECKMNNMKFRNKLKGTTEIEEWGEFNHCSDKIFYDFDEIRREIENRTALVAGTNKGITKEPIYLKIYSPHVVTLTLVDLPGITKVPVGDQPEDIEQQIKDLVMEYIQNPNSIILSVSAANVDLATSESLKFAREVDPQGERTLALLTKIDIMDSGTDAWGMLNGDIIPVKLGIVGVINRSQKDINENKTIDEQLEDERKFFETHYKSIAHCNGVPYLAKKLQDLLMKHISKCLPKLKMDIIKKYNETKEMLKVCGEEITDPKKFFMTAITNVSKIFTDSIDGTSLKPQKDKTKIFGGPKLRKVFDTKFVNALEEIEPDINKEDIVELIKTSGGPRPTVFAPEKIFKDLVNEQIALLREPSDDCAKDIYDEIENVINNIKCNEFIRFPLLGKRVRDVLIQVLDDRLPMAKNNINELIDIELNSINTNHPDFSIDDALKENIDTNNNYSNNSNITFPMETKSSVKTKKAKEQKEKIERDAEIVESLVRNYFPIVKKTIQDQVPKILLYKVVKFMQEKIFTELFLKLDDEKETLLNESEDIMCRRNRANDLLKALKIAKETVKQFHQVSP